MAVGENKEGLDEEDTVGVERNGVDVGEREREAVTVTIPGEVEGEVVALGSKTLGEREVEMVEVGGGDTVSVGVGVMGGVAVRDTSGEPEAVPGNHAVVVMD